MSRIRHAAVLAAVVGAATVAMAAPASAAPAVDSWQNCLAPIDGAVLCLTATPDPASETASVRASLTMEPGRTFGWVILDVSRCDWSQPDFRCDRAEGPVVRDANQVVTDPLPLDDAYDYWGSAAWSDDQGNIHYMDVEDFTEW